MTASKIIFDRVWKKFQRGQMHDSLRDLIPAVARRLLGREDESDLTDGDFWAVRDLSFEVLPGQCLGIIGPNGSGKSTTLKLLTRILEPTRGRCEMHGRAGTLIEISAGFHGDLTGRENVFLQGAIMGMTRADIVRKFDEIVEFSGVEESIDAPVKHYSSGMNARLGFSIAAHLEPDVLIIDEVLAVGDMAFQERAFGRIRDLTRSGIPVVMVSHQLDRISELCTSAILLNNGEAVTRGTPEDVIAAYVRANDERRASADTGVVRFEEVTVSSADVISGDVIEIRVRGRVMEPIADNIEPLRVRVRSLSNGNLVFATGSRWLDIDLSSVAPFDVKVHLQANMRAGNYTLEVAAHDSSRGRDIAAVPSVMLRVQDRSRFLGTTQLNPRLEVMS
jgi:ABC-type polysaccharide/polyol phosphate transport system ATPase subunit